MKKRIKASSLCVSIGIAALLCLPVTLLATDIAEAANTRDTELKTFYNIGPDKTKVTGHRPKTDSTPLYIRVDKKTLTSARVYADGAYSKKEKWFNKTTNGYGTVKKTGQFSLRSYVYEAGFHITRIGCWNYTARTGNIEGYWSPDSTRLYTCINNGYY